LKQTVLALADGLGLDESRAGLVCPMCKGGVHKDKAFVVTRKADGVLYYCYRVTCGYTGMIHSIDRELMKNRKRKSNVFVPRPYEYKTIELSTAQQEWFNGKYGITASELVDCGVSYNPERNSYVYPIRDYRGYEIGYEDRVYDGSRDCKSIQYWVNDSPTCHFTTLMVREQQRIVVVEDMLSGIRCSRYAPTVVALGTALGAKVEYLRRFTKNLVIYLDKDAMSTAMQVKNRYNMFFDSIKILYTRADPKDCSDDVLKKLLDYKDEL